MSDCCADATKVATRPSSAMNWGRVIAVFATIFLLLAGGVLLVIPLAASADTTPGAPSTTGHGVAAVHSAPPSAVQSGAALQHGPYLTNPGTRFSQLTNVSSTGPLTSAGPIRFTVGFQMQNATELARIIQDQQTPGSPLFHHWLTNAEEMSMFGPNPVTVQNTINYFTSLGFQVGVQGPISISFTGAPDQVNQAFRTQMQTVTFHDGSSTVMNTLPLSLPSAIAGGISTVNGLDQHVYFHPTHSIDPRVAQDMGLTGSNGMLAPAGPGSQLYSNISTAFNNSNRAFLWMYFYSHSRNKYYTWQTITPGSLTWLYNGTQLINQGYNGNTPSGQINIAIVMAGGINPDDMAAYGRLVWNNPNNILNRLTPVPVDGSFTTNGTLTYTDGVSGEMALDIEYTSTMAPGAHITAVYGPCLCTNVLDDDYATLWTMARTPNIISNSWGGDEDTSGNLYGPNYQNDQTMHFYFMLLAGKGASILASSADGGGFDKNTGILAGSFPATDPYVLSVDGLRTAAADTSGAVFPKNTAFGISNITVYTRANYPNWIAQADHMAYQSYWYEPVSNTTLQTLPPQGSGGFGISYWFNQSWWQHAPNVPDVGRSLGSGVAAEADFNQTIYFDGGFQFFYGGTSFACPTVAGELALIESYLVAKGTTAYPGYLGNGNVPVWQVANAWLNQNLTLIPYYDVNNGTSFWGNRGVTHGYSWPPGQKFPTGSSGEPIYGNTMPGYDFPTGWGSMNVYNFAVDLNYLYSLPGTFMTVNTAGTAWNTGGWANMVLNHSYVIDVNASGVSLGSGPHVTIKFQPGTGGTFSFQPALIPTVTPSGGAGYQFTVDTSIAPFLSPGLIVFEFGNATQNTLGFSYSWIANPLPTTGSLAITVVDPGTASILGGYPEFSTVPGFGFYAPPVVISPPCCTAYPNSFTVRVTFNGQPVYNAIVTAAVASPYSFAWQGSRFQNLTDSQGRSFEKTFNIVSQTFTNISGYAIVDTWNVVQPTTFFVNASYSSATAATTYQVVPGPNIKTTDNFGGKYSGFNTVAFLLQQYRQPVSPAMENLYVPNSVHQSAYYSMIYGWAGERLNVSTNDWQGSTLSGIKVWLGTLDTGGENKFYHYQATGGLYGVTNSTGTSSVTDPNGNATLQIPDNMTGIPFFLTPQGNITYQAYVAASMPGENNRTFSYTEPCAPTKVNINPVITCYFNNTYQRNYTSIPLLVLPDPVNAWTETPALVHRDFFNVGQNVSWGVDVNLPNNDPFVTGFGYNWGYGVEHITAVTAWVDGAKAGDMTPSNNLNWQSGFHAFENFSNTYSPGIHVLTVVVNDSVGHTFTRSHTFIVGSVDIQNLNFLSTYKVIPFTLNWTLNLPANQVNNYTFNQSVNIRYIAPGCGGRLKCPEVVNLTEKIHNGQVAYNQSINMTMLQLKNFYAGSGQLPPGQYQIIVWLNANKTDLATNSSGSIANEVTTYFVFQPIFGQINGPTRNEVVPLGNVTLSYAYSGDYVTNASLLVFAAGQLTSPVFTVGAFVPGLGLRGGAAVWPAVQEGQYMIALVLGSPYANYTATQWINVSAQSGTVYLNQTHSGGPLGSMNPAMVATVLALIAAIVGLIIGLIIAPTLRGGRTATGPSGPAKAWSESTTTTTVTSGKPTCAVCHDSFETDFAMHQHQKIVHGIEE